MLTMQTLVKSPAAAPTSSSSPAAAQPAAASEVYELFDAISATFRFA